MEDFDYAYKYSPYSAIEAMSKKSEDEYTLDNVRDLMRQIDARQDDLCSMVCYDIDAMNVLPI